MKVVISWSGDRSKAVAEAWHAWLPQIIYAVQPWMSEHDIDKGRRWNDELAEALKDANFGIVCLTPDNLDSRWIHFESGAIAKQVDHAYLWTFLHHLQYSDVTQPLAEFQHTASTRDDIRKLVATINRVAVSQGHASIREANFATAFEKWWPDLERSLSSIPAEPAREATKRGDEDVLEEILYLTRSLAVGRPGLGPSTVWNAAMVNAILEAAYEIAVRNAVHQGMVEPGEPPLYATGDQIDAKSFKGLVDYYLGWPE